jgi:branched-chain amino acid transport system permease protein
MKRTINTLVKPGILALLLVVAITFPFLFGNPTYTTIAIFALGFAAAASGWNIFSGYTGYIALGHAAYFGIGGYALAIICQRWHIPGGWEPFWLIPLAGLIAAAFAIPLGFVALRTRRHTFVVVTIATFFVLQLMAYNLRFLTNGSTGIDFPLILQWGADVYNLPFYYAALLLTLLALGASWFIRSSKFGLGLLAIRDDEDRALGLGVRTGPSKLVAFMISAFFAGTTGALLSYFIGNVQPTFTFDALFDVAIALMVFMGGIGTLSGPILGALVLESSQQYMAMEFTQGSGGAYLIVYGGLFLIVILLLPKGIVPSLAALWQKYIVRRLSPPDSSPDDPSEAVGGAARSALVNEEASA